MSSVRSEAQYLLLPVNPWFIGFTLILAFLITLLPVGRLAWVPDVLAVVIAFWSVRQPRRVGLLIAFLSGICIDVHHGSLLGQHALAYSLISFLSITLHRRLLWFGLIPQALHLLPLFLAVQVIVVGIRMLSGGLWPGMDIWLAPVLQAALWPIASVILLAPQRAAVDPDENRPI
jgi:rod shape-determining protein MreD